MKAAIAQIMLYNDIDANATTISNFIARASQAHIDLLCFPECSVTGYVRDFTTVDANTMMHTVQRIQEQVIHDSVNVIVGAPYVDDRGKRFNSAIALLTNGKRYMYHKINLTSSETAYFDSGTTPLTFPLKEVTFGVLICRDQNDAMLARTYKTMGVDALVILAAHFYEPREANRKLDKNRALPIARAVENGLFVLKANAVGSANGTISCGDSILVDPNGYVVQEADHRTEMILSCNLTKIGKEPAHKREQNTYSHT